MAGYLATVFNWNGFDWTEGYFVSTLISGDGLAWMNPTSLYIISPPNHCCE